MITAVTLSDPARGLTLAVKPSSSIALQGLEVTAGPRAVTDALPGGDGAWDGTAYLDSAAVTLDVTLLPPARALLDQFALFCSPRARPYLVVSDDEWASDRRLLLRWDSHQHPIVAGTGLARRCQFAWKAPEGTWQDATLRVQQMAADVADEAGIPVSAADGLTIADDGLHMPASTSRGAALVTVAGTAAPRWKAKLYGPATGPKLTNESTGQTVAFTAALTIPAGDYVEIDSDGQTALYLSQPDASRLALMDFTATEWWDLEPGTTQLVRYHASSGTGPGSLAELSYVPLWMP